MWKRNIFPKFIYDDNMDLPPIVVVSNLSPYNAQEFFIHIILPPGKYVTEIYVLHVGSPCECLGKQDILDLKIMRSPFATMQNELLFKYIVEQLVYCSNSLCKLGGWIVMASRFLKTSLFMMNSL